MQQNQLPVLAVHDQARKPEDVEIITAKRDALNLIARKAGFTTYQEMTRHIWDRLIVLAADRKDAQPVLQSVFGDIIDRAYAAMLAAPKKPK